MSHEAVCPTRRVRRTCAVAVKYDGKFVPVAKYVENSKIIFSCSRTLHAPANQSVTIVFILFVVRRLFSYDRDAEPGEIRNNRSVRRFTSYNPNPKSFRVNI